MYIIYNHDGSIKEKNLNEFIQQGDNLTKKIKVAIVGYDATAFSLSAVFKLPNGEQTVLVSDSTTTIKDKEDNHYQGIELALTEAETALEGVVKMTIRAIENDTDKTLTTFVAYLSINEGADPGSVAMMSIEAYENLIEAIQSQVSNNETILTFKSSMPSASNYDDNQLIYFTPQNEDIGILFIKKTIDEVPTWKTVYDFSNYYKKHEINNLLAEKSTVSGTTDAQGFWYTLTIDGVTHQIGGSGGGTTYTAGTGIDITGNTISADFTVVLSREEFNNFLVQDFSHVYNDVNEIRSFIPAQASPTNKLADKDFVNSSIATSRATFRGTYNIVTDLGLTTSATHSEIATAIATKLASLSIVADDNDYCYVAYPDATVSTQYTQFDEYKFNGTIWEYEFTLNNSSFTAAQWAAINSGVTADLVSKAVTIDGDQTITGRKIFTGNNSVYFGKANSPTRIYQDGASIKFGSRIQIAQIFPMTNKEDDLGNGGLRWYWRDVWFARNIVTLDENGNQITIPGNKIATTDNIQEIKTQSTGGATSIQLKTWVGTQAQYDSILTKDANTQYIII